MGRVQVVLDADVEKLLRDRCKKKGDMSKFVNEALREQFKSQ